MLRYGPWVSDCIKVLIKLPDMHVNDCRLVVWAKLQRIAEESLSVIGFENGTLVDFRDAQTRFVLNCGVERALRWMQEVPQDVLHGVSAIRPFHFEGASCLTFCRTINHALPYAAHQSARSRILRRK